MANNKITTADDLRTYAEERADLMLDRDADEIVAEFKAAVRDDYNVRSIFITGHTPDPVIEVLRERGFNVNYTKAYDRYKVSI